MPIPNDCLPATRCTGAKPFAELQKRSGIVRLRCSMPLKMLQSFQQAAALPVLLFKYVYTFWQRLVKERILQLRVCLYVLQHYFDRIALCVVDHE
jgi:hypothetical protein